MKANKIKTVLKYHKSSLPQLTMGYSNGKYLEFTNIDTTVRIYGVTPTGTYDIEGGEIYNNQQMNDDTASNWPKPVELGEKIASMNLEGLQEKLVHLSKFTGNDDLRPQYSGLGVCEKSIVASDTHVLSYLDHGQKFPKEFQKTIGYATTKLIDKDATSIDFYEKYTVLHTTVNGIKAEVIDRIPDGKFPNYKVVLPEASYYNKSVNIPQKLLKEMVDADKKYGNPTRHAVKIFNDKWEVEDKDFGTKYNGEIKISQSSPKEVKTIIMPIYLEGCEFAFNVKMLSRIAGKHDMTLFYNENNKAICIEYIEGEKTSRKKLVKKDDTAKLLAKIEALQKENEELKAEIEKSKDNLDALPTPKVEIVDYSEKAIALFGEATKEFKEQIKSELFGKFVPRLTKDGAKTPGWIVSKRYKAQARTLFA